MTEDLKGSGFLRFIQDTSHDQDPSTRYLRDKPVRIFTFRNDRIPILIHALRDVENSKSVSDSQEQDSYSEVSPRTNPIEISCVIQ